MNRFEQEHRKWLDSHLKRRSGERKRRLQAGHAHAEIEMLKKAWMPAFGHLQHLHPEYEVRDFPEAVLRRSHPADAPRQRWLDRHPDRI